MQIKFKKNLILKRIIFILFMIITLVLIFGFSSQNGETSGELSKKITVNIIEILSKFKKMDENMKNCYIEILHPIIRKLAHFSLYAFLGFSTMGLFCTFNLKDKYKILWSILIGFTYAASDEYHQSFTPGRGPSIQDVGIDTFGAIFGIFIMIFLIILANIIFNNNKK